MKLNIMGLISAILAFISMVLPWYSISSIITIHFNLLDIANLASLAGSVPGAQALQTWFIWVALVFLIIGGLLGLVGSFIIGKNGKNLLLAGGALVLLSPIIFAIGAASQGLQLFGSVSYFGYTITYFLSFGFFLALIAAIVMLFSTRKHSMEAGAAPASPP